MDKKRLVIIITVAVIIIAAVAAIIFTATRGNQAPTDTEDEPVSLRVDKDTGEQTITDPNLNGRAEDTSSIVVLGLDDLIEKTGIPYVTIRYIREQIQTYGIQTLGSKYTTLTIRPQDTAVNGDTITSTIRLGDSDKTVNFVFTGYQSETLQVKISDPTRQTADFTSQPLNFSGD